jgi:hypothetical protein
MFQQMLNASLAVLRRPSVSTFEEFERDDLGAATVYVLLGALISGILGVIAFAIRRPFIGQPLRERPVDQPFAFDPALMPQSWPTAIGGNLIGTLIGFFLFLGLVFLLGRAFGGTGTFGQLAYDISLFWAPLAVIQALISIFAIGPLAFLSGLALFAVGIYNLYLTYLGIQSGMNLPPNKALIIILIPFFLAIVLCCVLALAVGALIGVSGQR